MRRTRQLAQAALAASPGARSWWIGTIAFALLVASLIFVSRPAAGSLGPPTVVESRVATSSDDAEETAEGEVSLFSTDLELVRDEPGGDQLIGMRWR